MTDSILALDIGGTKIAGGVLVDGAHLEHRLQVPTHAELGAEAVMAVAIDLADRLRECTPAATAIGVGTVGQVDYSTGRVLFANANLPGWTGMPIRERVELALALPAFVGNDVHLHALAETHAGAARGYRCVIMAAIGTGIGGGLILDGRLWTGVSGLAGELGHIQIQRRGPRCACGKVGCLEALASGPRIAAAYARATGLHSPISTQEVASRAAGGDQVAIQAFHTAAVHLGQALSGLVNVLNPDCLVIGGGVAEVGDLLLAPLRAYVIRQALPANTRNLAIVQAQLRSDAGVFGAGLLARASGLGVRA